ncbi:type I inositol 1,4,5-trisphosphate 5-phosphatase isoform X1 [Lingula anatina]|uniref:inositol-polyphosphate 5-phosphatase n=1 Tax=Lingula anatina TaxID=7574 RepID=A0A2R2MIE9_LINAN|nr:type I inositol 1,4,5-trisphosphate 5-phosphatase isoform X1 [Lingula anatina]|eukprot:XP_023929969.1 type I inositol 1,4,5-trisphosphate 5-phosphatase isoform X1 [Lingula anatina]
MAPLLEHTTDLTSKVMLITANVGSIFEDPERMLKMWLNEFVATVTKLQPMFLAIHMQEVGGKNYEESMQYVNHFIKTMLASEDLECYDKARVFLDEDFTAVDKFTALGSLYFAHVSMTAVEVFDFQAKKFVPFVGREVLSGNIESVPIKEKAKFPQNYFPECRWSRKGFIRTRWNICGSIFDLINIHLFHDANNIEAMLQSPSTYCEHRQRALQHTFERIENDEYEKVPFFLFGDFNFRLDTYYFMKDLTKNLVAVESRSKKNNELVKLTYKEADNDQKIVLVVEKKGFDHLRMKEIFYDNNGLSLLPYDKEIEPFRDRVYEHDINFPPSYPFSESLDDGVNYMKTRCPGWCDRIFVSYSAKSIIDDSSGPPLYLCIGKEVCMGDHKPIYLYFNLKHNAGKMPELVPEPQPSPHIPLRKILSINGEEVEPEKLDEINIHDYATFEKEQTLHPITRQSFKRKGDSEGMNGRSFHDIARDVMKEAGVLSYWKTHPGYSSVRRNRHHSSSSEDELSESQLEEEDSLTEVELDLEDDHSEEKTRDDGGGVGQSQIASGQTPSLPPPTNGQCTVQISDDQSLGGEEDPKSDVVVPQNGTDDLVPIKTPVTVDNVGKHNTDNGKSNIGASNHSAGPEQVVVVAQQQAEHAQPARRKITRHRHLSSLSRSEGCPCGCVLQ